MNERKKMILIDDKCEEVISIHFSIYQMPNGKVTQVIETGAGFPPMAKIFDSVAEAFEDFGKSVMTSFGDEARKVELMTEEEKEALRVKADKMKEELQDNFEELKKVVAQKIKEELEPNQLIGFDTKKIVC